MATIGAGFLVLHGLITSFIGFGQATHPTAPAVALPNWFAWWPGPFGRSWLFDALHASPTVTVAGGLLWLAAGIALVTAGLGWLGVAALAGPWQLLAVIGGALGLVALVVYFHPLYVAAVLINVAVVLLVWRTPTAAV